MFLFDIKHSSNYKETARISIKTSGHVFKKIQHANQLTEKISSSYENTLTAASHN
jgi:hypothetical protein